MIKAPAPNVESALSLLERINAHCFFMKQLIENQPEATLGKADWQGLGHVFENIIADLECVMSDLDPT